MLDKDLHCQISAVVIVVDNFDSGISSRLVVLSNQIMLGTPGKLPQECRQQTEDWAAMGIQMASSRISGMGWCRLNDSYLATKFQSSRVRYGLTLLPVRC